MKAKSTIRKEMNRLFKAANDPSNSIKIQAECWLMATALQWVVETVSWTPHKIVKIKEAKP